MMTRKRKKFMMRREEEVKMHSLEYKLVQWNSHWDIHANHLRRYLTVMMTTTTEMHFPTRHNHYFVWSLFHTFKDMGENEEFFSCFYNLHSFQHNFSALSEEVKESTQCTQFLHFLPFFLHFRSYNCFHVENRDWGGNFLNVCAINFYECWKWNFLLKSIW